MSENSRQKTSKSEIILAKSAGFCFGVDRAVKEAYALAGEGRKAVTLGPLIHNPQVVADLAQKGILEAQTPADVPAGYDAIIRSHGVGREVYEQLAARDIVVHDATCPFVAKIHKLAKQQTEEGRVLFVAGERDHPEVQGIVGHAVGEVHVFGTADELPALLHTVPADRPVSVVAQTTYRVDNWEKAEAALKKAYTNIRLFDTMCSATWMRQKEAQQLSRQCDVVVIVGGRHSSNTQKLASVCAEHCRAILVETADELDVSQLRGAKRIGLTAGASTPSSLIEEVRSKMDETLQEMDQSSEIDEGMEMEQSFEEMLEASLKPVFRGKKVKGVVTGVAPSEVTVDIGTKQTGFIPAAEFSDDSSAKLEELVKKGDELNLVVMQVNDQEGTVMLSKRRFDNIAGMEEVQKAAETGETVSAFIQEEVKGGLVASVKGVRIFIPASQSSVRRGEELGKLVKTKQDIKILELSGRRAIGSIRAVLSEQTSGLRDKFWTEAEVGKHYDGVVKSLTSYGAFVDLGGVDGLVHISELSWNRLKHPSEVVNVGDHIDVYIKDLNPETKKVSLGYRTEEGNPWNKLKEIPLGTVFTGPVVSITKFGAFVRILPGIDGLVHISEIAKERIEKVSDKLSMGQEVEVQLTDVDFERKRVSLSMRSLLADKEADGEEETVYSSENPPKEQAVNLTEETEAAAPEVEEAAEEIKTEE